MKVQIVYLSPEDDIHSACDMLGWVKAPRALLIWPDEGSVLKRRLDLVLLKRFSIQRNIEIGLLTFDKDIRDEASEIGIPVFDSFDDLPEEVWSRGNLPQADQREEVSSSKLSSIEFPLKDSVGRLDGLGRSQRGLILSGILLCLIAVIGLLLPSANVTLTPSLVKENLGLRIDLTEAGFGETSVGLIPVQTIALRSEGIHTRECSGFTQVPISTATGKVIFTNLSQEIIQIPTNTILRATMDNVIRFRTIRPAILKGEIGSEVEVPIQALVSGWTGNVPIGSISEVESTLGLSVEVFNEEPTSGGKAEIRKMVLQSDLDRLEEEFVQMLMMEAERDWAASQPSDRIPVEGSLELRNILSKQIDHRPGEVADTVSIELSLEFSAATISAKDLQELIMMTHSNVLSGNFHAVPDTFSFVAQMQPFTNSSDQRWIQVDVDVDTYRALDIGIMKDAIRGRKPQTAAKLLFKRYPLSRQPEFSIEPSWYPILPVLAQRIKINWSWELGM